MFHCVHCTLSVVLIIDVFIHLNLLIYRSSHSDFKGDIFNLYPTKFPCLCFTIVCFCVKNNKLCFYNDVREAVS
jgi:hypothetical protein